MVECVWSTVIKSSLNRMVERMCLYVRGRKRERETEGEREHLAKWDVQKYGEITELAAVLYLLRY